MKPARATASWTIGRPQFAPPGTAGGLLFRAAALAAFLMAPQTAPAAILAQQAYVKASNPKELDLFGWSVAVSGDTMVVGAPYEDSDATGVNGTVSGTNAPSSGAAYIFVRTGSAWMPQAYLKASNTGGEALGDSFGDGFGYSVAVSGDTVVVGAIYEDSNATGVDGDQSDNSASLAGAAYVFVRDGTNWSQQAYLKASNTSSNQFFGWSVAASGDTVAVGAYGESSNATGVNGNQSDHSVPYSGAVYVFVRSGTNWTQQAYLKASNVEENDFFGTSLSLSGDTAVVGASGEASGASGVDGDETDNTAPGSGAAYVFARDGTNWTQQAYLKASNTGGGSLPFERGDEFGYSVVVAGNTLVVGAPGEASSAVGVNGNQSDNGAASSGAAYVFVREGTNWSQQAYLKSSNPGRDHQFGHSVSASTDMIVVGAFGEDSNGSGVTGGQSGVSGTNSGAACVFVRNGTNWSQQAYLKASNSEAYDAFGFSVSMSGDTVVVGAVGEDSHAGGLIGNQGDNSASAAGAAYVFTGFCPACPTLALAPDGSGGYFLHFIGVPDVTYRLLRASSPTGPWDNTVATFTPAVFGPLEYHDTNAPPGQAFYRTVQP